MSESIFSPFRILLIAVTLAAALPELCASSLWVGSGNRERGMFADVRAGQVGDILTVIVQESSTATSSVSTSTSRSASMDESIDRFFFTPGASNFGTKGGILPGFSLDSQRDFSGGGQINNSSRVATRAAVVVVDVLPNGNLVIEGARQITMSGETQYAVLRGIVRPADVTPANTVLSTSIADAQVEFITRGTLTDAQRKGWLGRLLEKLALF